MPYSGKLQQRQRHCRTVHVDILLHRRLSKPFTQNSLYSVIPRVRAISDNTTHHPPTTIPPHHHTPTPPIPTPTTHLHHSPHHPTYAPPPPPPYGHTTSRPPLTFPLSTRGCRQLGDSCAGEISVTHGSFLTRSTAGRRAPDAGRRTSNGGRLTTRVHPPGLYGWNVLLRQLAGRTGVCSIPRATAVVLRKSPIVHKSPISARPRKEQALCVGGNDRSPVQ